MMHTRSRDYQSLCNKLLHAESEEDVLSLIEQADLMDSVHWKPLGDMPNNRSVVNNQQQYAGGALVEKIVNGIDATLTKECFLRGIPPESPKAPRTMAAAAEQFFKIPDGNLANLTATELTELAENVQLVATGSKQDPCYLIIDKGEGQTPAHFGDTFLSLTRTNKAGIPFVQGKFNCGGTGVLPFCGKHGLQLIISRRCPDLPSDPTNSRIKDATHQQWGFTLLRKLPPSAGRYLTTVYVYLAPDGEVPRFDAKEVLALPEVGKATIGEDLDEDENEVLGKESRKDSTPRPYRIGLTSGTIIKLYKFRWKAHSLATRDARFELERYLHHLSLPIRITEARHGYHANYYATTVAGTSVTVAKDREKGFLEDNFPAGGEIQPDGIGRLPISITLYRERTSGDPKAKAAKRLPKGLFFTINGQVHYWMGPEVFVTRGLSYDFIKDTLLVTIDCTNLPEDIRDQLIMPSRDRLRGVPEFELILDGVIADLKDRDVLRTINDQRKLRRVKDALSQDAVQDVFQSLINKDSVFASLFRDGRGLRNPFTGGPAPPKPPYCGKMPPTHFHFENGKHEITKSFPIDRTCAVELETDAVNGYFELPNPNDRGEVQIEPKCYERWNLWNGRLRIVFRAPANARIGDSLRVAVTVVDPCVKARGGAPWVNHIKLVFAEGGKEAKPGGRERTGKEVGSLGMPQVVPVYRSQWENHGFDAHSALRISKGNDSDQVFFVNMDNLYLENELLRRKDPEKEAAKFAYQWGLVLVALGMLQELKTEAGKERKEKSEEEAERATLEEEVARFSRGVAAVIIPTVLNLMEVMNAPRSAVPVGSV